MVWLGLLLLFLLGMNTGIGLAIILLRACLRDAQMRPLIYAPMDIALDQPSDGIMGDRA